MKTAWFFGDSFTYGDGLHSYDEFPQKFPEKVDKLWTELLSEEFKWNHRNEGIPGASSQRIIFNLIKHLSSIKEGDIVIISDTIPIRMETIQLYDDEELGKQPIISTNNSEVFIYDNLDPKDVIRNTEEDIPILVDYIHSYLFKHEKVWERYWLMILQDLQKHLQTIGVECYLWSFRIWGSGLPKFQYSTIHEESNKEVNNHHWGWEGQKSFYNYFRTRILEKKYFVPSEYYILEGIYEPELI